MRAAVRRLKDRVALNRRTFALSSAAGCVFRRREAGSAGGSSSPSALRLCRLPSAFSLPFDLHGDPGGAVLEVGLRARGARLHEQALVLAGRKHREVVALDVLEHVWREAGAVVDVATRRKRPPPGRTMRDASHETSEMSTPLTCPMPPAAWMRPAMRPMVAPPPQPMSSARSPALNLSWSSAQFVTSSWLRFMRSSICSPNWPCGLPRLPARVIARSSMVLPESESAMCPPSIGPTRRRPARARYGAWMSR